jgi:hypothetical protein
MKQEYLNMRFQGKFDFEFMFKYWLRNGGSRIPPQQFVQILQTARMLDIFDHLDKVFEVSVLLDQNGKQIKVIG